MRRCLPIFLVLLSFSCKRERPSAPAATPTPAPTVAGAATASAAGTRLHVWTTHAVLLDAPKHGSKEIERVPIGTAVTTEPAAEGFVKIVSGTKKSGFLPATSIAMGKPDAKELLAAARQSLAEGKPGDASADAERAAALSPTVEAHDLLEAIYEAAGDSSRLEDVVLRRREAKLPAPTPTPDAGSVTASTAKVGDERWVAATSLLLKEKPDVKAKTVAELPIGTKVKILAETGEWRVVEGTVEVLSTVEIDFAGTAVKSAAGGTRVVRGNARLRFLAAAPPSRDALVAEADAFEKKGELAEATRRLERAVALDADPALVKRLARVAVSAKLYRIAARASERMSWMESATGDDALVLDQRLLWGCRGDRTRALIVTQDQAASAPADACIAEVDDVAPCEPCSPSNILVAEAESMDWESEAEARILTEGNSEDPESLEAIRSEVREAHRARIESATADYEAEVKNYEAELEAWRAEVAPHSEEAAQLRTQFAAGPFLQVVLPPSNVEGQLFVWSRSVEVAEAYCDNVVLRWSDVSVSGPIPRRSPATRTLWVSAGATDHATFGVVEAATKEAVIERITGARDGDNADAGAPDASLFPGLQVCTCCGC